jgi:hypothetical protein
MRLDRDARGIEGPGISELAVDRPGIVAAAAARKTRSASSLLGEVVSPSGDLCGDDTVFAARRREGA